MELTDLSSYFTEQNIRELLERYRSFGPLPGIALTFLKSFVPPLPTLLIVGINAAVYGLWPGFLYSWLGIVGGSMTTFLIVRAMAAHPFLERWARRPKVAKRLKWMRRNAFGYVFLLSLFPVGPFVVVNMAAAIARMRIRSFLIAAGAGKGVMVFSVSYLGHDVGRLLKDPLQIVYVVLFVAASLLVSKRIEAYFAGKESAGKETGGKEAARRADVTAGNSRDA
ncbi:TVP38/TMEM64 family protein [Paenibacillus beijingensis]|uniref:TVP38/TMEM64 family membrane protein n=1 Tax=Paenibacillus beijingensis TaxID=1126833 RepID=A0A0D5NR07_9BACL|nr:TVP38/TMEM64 family protein [Paenibacillus beijingensis]AJY77686.1 hypothetical protein VN24_12190 [Paenibacillus beijingensis]